MEKIILKQTIITKALYLACELKLGDFFTEEEKKALPEVRKEEMEKLALLELSDKKEPK